MPNRPWTIWFPLFINDFQGSPRVRALSPAGAHFYLNLLLAQWQSDDCRLPDDDAELAILAGANGEWPQHRAAIRRFFLAENGWLWNPRCREEWEKAKESHEKRQLGGRTTAAKRWHSDSPAIAQLPLGNRYSQSHSQSNTQQEEHPPTPLAGEAPAPKSRTRKPPAEPVEISLPDWVPAVEWQAFLAMRAEIKHPVSTPSIAKALLRTLTRLRAAGNDPAAVLDQATTARWRGLFEVKANGTKSRQPVDNRESGRLALEILARRHGGAGGLG